MTNEIKLAAETRLEKNGKAKKVLSGGLIPANIYGSGSENKNLQVKKLDFERVYETAGESNLINLTIDGGEPVKVIVKDIQKGSVKNEIIHIDFYRVDMKKKITIDIPFKFVGESKAVRELGGTIIKSLDSVEAECLPGDLIKEIEVDLSKLENFGDVIKLSDLAVPSGIEFMSDDDLVIASAAEIREEKFEAKAEAPAEAEAAAEKAESGEEKKEENKKK